jgi:RES domain-containing protein
MLVYRITKRKFSADISGTGSALFPGRWNKFGTPVLYTGETKEIALLEILVNASSLIINDLDILTLEIPDSSISELKISELPKNWNEYPPPSKLAYIGQEWVFKGETLALRVPSCIIQSSRNVVLNCNHKDFKEVKVINHSKFELDTRFTKR